MFLCLRYKETGNEIFEGWKCAQLDICLQTGNTILATDFSATSFFPHSKWVGCPFFFFEMMDIQGEAKEEKKGTLL